MRQLWQDFAAQIQRSWYRPHWLNWPLLPLSWLFALVAAARRQCYDRGILKKTRVGVPVIVVGNITVGGSGKTSFVIWLVEMLQAQGYKPAILSRGYRGLASYWPQQVRGDSDPKVSGDEPVLLARRCGCPVVISPDRVAGARALLLHMDCDLIVTDDGLQHYALERDLEIVMVDAERRFGNGRLLPAGPLREPVSRLKKVDYVVSKGASSIDRFQMITRDARFCKLLDPNTVVEASLFRGQRVHAVAGIGDPGSYFDHLQTLGIRVIEHPFPDHHTFREDELCFGDDLPVLMTEKDAVKCRGVGHDLCWYLTFEVDVSGQLAQKIATRLEALGVDRQKAA